MITIPEQLTLDFLANIHSDPIQIPESAYKRVAHNRDYLDNILQTGNTYYGINTGFGSLCNVRIADDELSQLQENLVCSHACGMGDEVPREIVKLMLLLKIHGLGQGYSGVRTKILDFLAALYNKDILPIVYEQGSLGASGDLAPLAHLCLPMLGKGKVWYKGAIHDASYALEQEGLVPISLAAKEGLALLNGTQFMSSYGTWSLIKARRLAQWADLIGALSADAFDAKPDPFRHPIHKIRPHAGQIHTARQILRLLEGSELQQQPKTQVQDPYSFRCMPQVHGASKDVIDTVSKVVETEINAVTDNPIVFHDEDVVLSGGNFHGQPLALHLDFLAIGLAELANISERRIYLLISGQRGLPPFLSPNPGVNSGLMIAQYTAASIVSQNKQLCSPASVDSIVSSNGQEDHVSMGANAATKLYRVVKNVQRVLAIELLTAAQGLDMRRPLRTSPVLENMVAAFREKVSFMEKDRVLYTDMDAAFQFLDQDPSEWLS